MTATKKTTETGAKSESKTATKSGVTNATGSTAGNAAGNAKFDGFTEEGESLNQINPNMSATCPRPAHVRSCARTALSCVTVKTKTRCPPFVSGVPWYQATRSGCLMSSWICAASTTASAATMRLVPSSGPSCM